MAKFKTNKQYYFSVEGETEQLYLNWLQKLINETAEATYTVTFDCPVQKNPVKRAKSINIRGKTDIYHFSDYESGDEVHVNQFLDTMSNMKAAGKLGRQIKYHFSYSNLTFELWMVLHKTDCNGALAHRRQYLQPINKAYNEKFSHMDEFKKEQNFKRILSQLSLSNVKDAVSRAKQIMKKNEENGYTLHEYKGYKYYKDNPSLTVWEIIEKVLEECELI